MKFFIKLFRKRTKNFKARFSPSILEIAGTNFFGQKSKGYMQICGNGILVLTDSVLAFGMWMPKKELIIPLSMIVSIETTKWFLGKTKSFDLLKVNFRNKKGKLDSAAWWIKDLSKWLETLKANMYLRKGFGY